MDAHDDLARMERVNAHWLNQKALGLLRASQLQPVLNQQHVLTLLWEISQRSTAYQLGEWPLEEIVADLLADPPELALKFLVGEDGEDQEVHAHHMAEVHTPEDMLIVLWGTLHALSPSCD